MFSSKRYAYRPLLSLSVALTAAFYMPPAFSADSAAPIGSVGTLEEKLPPDYVTRAANIDLGEMTIGKLAREKAQNGDVEALALHLTQNHSEHMTELTKLIAHPSALPQKLDPEHQKIFDKLQTLSGAEFDEAFTHAMVEGHKKAIALYEDASKNEPNAPLRNFFANTIPTLQEHLRMAQKTDATLAARANGKEPTNTNVSTPDKTMKTR